MADVYAFDSNVYIHALRSPASLAALKRVLLRAGTRVRVSAVVAFELRAGAHTEQQAEGVEALIRPYAERDHVVVPTFEAFLQAGRILSALFRTERLSTAFASRSLRSDALLAASCREVDVVVVTDNARDFTAIRRHLRGFRFTDLATLDARR